MDYNKRKVKIGNKIKLLSEVKKEAGYRYINLAQLKEYYEQSKKEDWRVNPDKYYHSFGKGWYSTCKKDPMHGLLFKTIDSPVVIEFKTKYGQKLTGIVKAINYDDFSKTVDMSVMSTDCGFSNEPINYGISFKSKIKVLEGQLPDPKKEFAQLKKLINI